MNCNISSETLTALHEHSLPWWHVLLLKTHTHRCATCQAQLIHFTSLDSQLRALTPAPLEISLMPLRRRRALLGSSIALVMLGLGTWRFFTPEIEWADVEKAMSDVKTVQWRSTLTTTPGQTATSSLVTQMVLVMDPTFQRTEKTSITDYAYSIQPQRKLAIEYASGGSHLPSQDNILPSGILGSILIPKRYTKELKTSVIFKNRHRLIEFSASTSDNQEIFRVFADPKTKRIICREHSWAYKEVDNYQIHEINNVTSYNSPISQEFYSKVNCANWDYIIINNSENEEIQKLISFFTSNQDISRQSHFIKWNYPIINNSENEKIQKLIKIVTSMRRTLIFTHSTKFTRPTKWNYTISADIMNESKGIIPSTEAPILNINLYPTESTPDTYHYRRKFQAQKQPDGSFKINPRFFASKQTKATETPSRRVYHYISTHETTNFRIQNLGDRSQSFKLYL
ncbi:hypothetical protein [Armatimonas sp.]|uniref:hypothetical protein n=1 Tax=Armatimonas sp. TaxID=1872638 RepID=UPI003750B3F5